MEPSPADPSGRSRNGQFAPGNAIGKGNPHAKKVQRLRAALIDAVDEKDLKAIIRKLVSKAKAGDTIAAREILDRTIGKAVQADLLRRIEELENIHHDH